MSSTIENHSRERWSQDFLLSKRSISDSLADSLIEKTVHSDGSTNWQITSLFSAMVRNSSPIPDELPETLKDYFADLSLPSWANQQQILIGQKLFGQYGLEIVLLLFCRALPLTYSCGHGAEVLVRTGRLTEKTLEKGEEDLEIVNRRIMETAQFIMNVMAPGGFGTDGDGKGLRTAQKIRLIHASIRHFLLTDKTKKWDSNTFGQPINQEDMAGTLMAFSVCMTDGLINLGIKISDDQAEAYLHCWKVVGYFLGVEQSLMPEDISSARLLIDGILENQSGPSPAGKLLTKSLIDYMASRMPFGMGAHLPALLMRKLNGDKMANELGIASVPKWREWLIFGLYKFCFTKIGHIESSNSKFANLASRFSRWLLQEMIIEQNHLKKVRFYIPPSLTGTWSQVADRK